MKEIGWIIVPSEKGKFRVAFEDSELEQLVKDTLHNKIKEVKTLQILIDRLKTAIRATVK
ncbi:MAG: hypothetical protein J7K20_00035 [Thermodesulfobacterium sp.]|nr:hypothetical protein [Thermodesulfobacterium sp.]